jgi:hypothetical protein
VRSSTAVVVTEVRHCPFCRQHQENTHNCSGLKGLNVVLAPESLGEVMLVPSPPKGYVMITDPLDRFEAPLFDFERECPE